MTVRARMTLPENPFLPRVSRKKPLIGGSTTERSSKPTQEGPARTPVHSQTRVAGSRYEKDYSLPGLERARHSLSQREPGENFRVGVEPAYAQKPDHCYFSSRCDAADCRPARRTSASPGAPSLPPESADRRVGKRVCSTV